jgi:transmembrane serine protease 11G
MPFSLKRPGILVRRKRVWKPWTVALITVALLLALAVLIGLLVYFLVYGEAPLYYIT